MHKCKKLTAMYVYENYLAHVTDQKTCGVGGHPTPSGVNSFLLTIASLSKIDWLMPRNHDIYMVFTRFSQSHETLVSRTPKNQYPINAKFVHAHSTSSCRDRSCGYCNFHGCYKKVVSINKRCFDHI